MLWKSIYANKGVKVCVGSICRSFDEEVFKVFSYTHKVNASVGEL